MKIVVTGGAGFIGANVVRRLLLSESATDIQIVDDLSTGTAENLEGLPVVLHEGSILDGDLLGAVFEGAQAVIHLAARPSVPRSIADPLASHDANATGTVRVLEAARHSAVRHMIVASSSSVYGSNPVLPKHEDLVPSPVSPYAVSKLATEAYALAWAHCYGLDVLAFRFFNVFGPWQRPGHDYAAVLPAFLDAALAGRPLPIHGDGKQTRDFTYVGSVANVITAAIETGTSFAGPVNLAFGSRRSLLDVVGAIENQLEKRLPRQHADPRPGDVRHSQADQTLLRHLFPDIQPVPFETGLAATIEWFRTLGPEYG